MINILLAISICFNLFISFLYIAQAYDFYKFRKMVDREIDPVLDKLKERLKNDL